jgi:hypothetical protein
MMFYVSMVKACESNISVFKPSGNRDAKLQQQLNTANLYGQNQFDVQLPILRG